MKKLMILALSLLTLSAGAQTFPAPSLAAKTYQMVGVNGMEIDYSSPAARDREIFGKLVPYGKLWRTGANSATTLEADEVFVVGDTKVPAGKYAVFTIPQENEITVILNSNADQGGTGDYDKELDVARITVPFKKVDGDTERMQFTFENTTPKSTDLTFRWDDHMFVVPITVPTEDLVEEKMRAELEKGDADFNFYNSAANYYLEAGHAERALQMAQKSTEMNGKFYNTFTLAKAYKATGDKKNAEKASKESLKLAEEADYEHYIMLNKEFLQNL